MKLILMICLEALKVQGTKGSIYYVQSLYKTRYVKILPNF